MQHDGVNLVIISLFELFFLKVFICCGIYFYGGAYILSKIYMTNYKILNYAELVCISDGFLLVF